jgi:hypothetical protein
MAQLYVCLRLFSLSSVKDFRIKLAVVDKHVATCIGCKNPIYGSTQEKRPVLLPPVSNPCSLVLLSCRVRRNERHVDLMGINCILCCLGRRKTTESTEDTSAG